MITFDAFMAEWLGKKCDFDNAFGGQCVDLYRMYVQEVLGFPQSPKVDGAAAIWDTASHDHYDFIVNTPTGVPLRGDIIIWNRNAGGGFGHVAMFIEGNATSFVSFDQNWPTKDVCTKTKHNYTNVIGWMHPKENVMSGLPANYADIITKSTNWDKVCESQGFTDSVHTGVADIVKIITDAKTRITDLESQVAKDDETVRNLNQLVNEKNNIISKLQSSLSTQEQQLLDTTTKLNTAMEQAKLVPQLTEENEYLTNARDSWQKSEANYRKVITELQAKVGEYESNPIPALLKVILQKIFGHTNKN